MKRASLKTAIAPITSTTTPDVTDRILRADSTPRSDVPRPATPTSKRRPRAANPPVAIVPVADTDPIAQAVTQTRQALLALQQARVAAPAQYDLAIRVRLDALAHHLEQVAEFITRQTAQP